MVEFRGVWGRSNPSLTHFNEQTSECLKVSKWFERSKFDLLTFMTWVFLCLAPWKSRPMSSLTIIRCKSGLRTRLRHAILCTPVGNGAHDVHTQQIHRTIALTCQHRLRVESNYWRGFQSLVHAHIRRSIHVLCICTCLCTRIYTPQ